MSASLPTRWARAVAADRTQPPTAKLVALAALARFANSDGMTWCPIKQVMELTGCSRTSVKTALRSLRAGRWVVATAPARHHIAPHYELRIPESGGPISDPLPASKGGRVRPSGGPIPAGRGSESGPLVLKSSDNYMDGDSQADPQPNGIVVWVVFGVEFLTRIYLAEHRSIYVWRYIPMC